MTVPDHSPFRLHQTCQFSCRPAHDYRIGWPGPTGTQPCSPRTHTHVHTDTERITTPHGNTNCSSIALNTTSAGFQVHTHTLTHTDTAERSHISKNSTRIDARDICLGRLNGPGVILAGILVVAVFEGLVSCGSSRTFEAMKRYHDDDGVKNNCASTTR
jgi:hypothetical protein